MKFDHSRLVDVVYQSSDSGKIVQLVLILYDFIFIYGNNRKIP